MRLRAAAAVAACVVAGCPLLPAAALDSAPASDALTARAPGVPLSVTTVVGGLSAPWDVAFVADGTMFFTERAGRISVRLTTGTVRQLAADMGDIWASGETGLMGIEVDPDFTSNRRLYTCQGTLDNDRTAQVVAWVVDAALTRVDRVNDPLVGGIDGTSGRHGGCQLRVTPDGALLVGTGDAATGTNPQNLGSLAGKTLRVNRFTGAGIAGNAPGGDGRVYTYGHRNVQGLAVRANGQLFSVEHGTDRDDEVNVLQAGRNYGWDPVPGYNEARPMTDFGKFPNAVGAAWSSGLPTIAPSGATFVRGAQWGPWNGALAVSFLAGQHLRLFFFDAQGGLVDVHVPPELDHRFGRLRGAEVGPDGALYITTSNGSGDVILRIAPSGPPPQGAGDDLVAVDNASGTTYVAASTGTIFFAGHAWLRGWAAGNFEMLLADANGDGRDDLIAKDLNGTWYVALSNGNGFNAAGYHWLTTWAWGTHHRILTGDVTGDGRDDLVAVDNASGTTYVAASTGTIFFAGHAWLRGWGAGNFEMLLADANGDGRDDLIAKDLNGTWYVALSNGNGFNAAGYHWLTTWAWGTHHRILTGDVTGDGRDDLVAVDNASGTTYVAASTGTIFFAGHAWLRGWAAGNFEMLLADANGDGRDDLIAKDLNGTWYVALSNGNGFNAAGYHWLTTWAWGTHHRILTGDVTGS